ncbi:TonB-dependent receptor [Porticoccus sp. W117]|uniref:TonB-dependent receptor plug domain-containing protein n=1 Tax=Porticoccus sp. W117 TaxID=3054777 RepID=UPI00259A4E51|nr:TonB-dependent receptor [Porticoccus sp. W117]MDM3870520.1 TonB-dependent receptor [Porticoccus sp. W117]
MKKQKIPVLIFATAIGNSTCWASDDTVTESDIYIDLPIVTGISRIDQLLTRAPASATVIDRQMIELSGAQNWTDLFRLVPGMQAYSVNGNRFGISYHGIGRELPNHMEVRVDGRSVYDPLFSAVNWSALSIELDDIERIEVIRGTNAASDGSNAFMGAINIITRDAIQDKGTTLRATVGSRGTRESSARFNGVLGKFNYRWSLGFQENDGFTDRPRGPDDDGQNLRHTELRATYSASSIDSIEFHIGHSNSGSGFGDADDLNAFATADFNQSFQSIKWQRLLQGNDELQLHFYHNRLQGDNSAEIGRLSELAVAGGLAPDIPTAIAILNNFGIEDGLLVGGFREIETERYDIELSHKFDIDQQLRAAWGMGVRHEMIDAEALLEPIEQVSQNSYRLFGNLEWQPAQRWIVNAGAIIEHNDTVNTIASPRLGVNYLIDDNHSLRFTVARGNRSPSLLEANEFNVDIVSNQLLVAIRRAGENLSEEKLTSYDIGYIANFPDRGLTLDARLYMEKIRDGLEQRRELITTSPLSDDDDIAVIDNIFFSDRKGIELQLKYQPDAKTLLAAQYSYTDLSGAPTPFGVPLENTNPTHTASLLFGKHLNDKLSASTTLYFQDDVQWRGGGEHHSSFTRWDAQLSYQLQLGTVDSTISLVAQNIGGGSYPDFNQNNRFHSRYFLELKLHIE